MAMLSTDPEYVAYQYADSEKLRIRIETHQRYTVGEDDFQATELQHLQVRPGQQLLDVGCGHGRLNGVLAPMAVKVVGLDRSSGMLREAQSAAPSASWVCGDAIALPFPDGQFDRVAALGVLYHVRDWPRALQEMRRVARTGGRIVISTNGPDAMRRILDLHCRAAIETGYVPSEATVSWFHLDHLTEVRRVFPDVEQYVVHSALEFPEPEPALRFYATNRIDFLQDMPLDGSHRARLLPLVRRQIVEIIRREGIFRVPKTYGYFVAEV
jgi:ubiquinone/menaquinone biosynthesis C-methylase UbiE